MRGPGAVAAAFLAFVVAAGGSARAFGQERRVVSPYTDALNLLEARGYVSFTGFNTFGDSFEAFVSRKGRRVMVLVDPRRRRIMLAP